MELLFELISNLGPGYNPSAVHLPNNDVILFSVFEGRLKYRTWTPEVGNVPWNSPTFGEIDIATADKNMSLVRLKNIPRVGIFGSWKQDIVRDESNNIITPERHRFAIWDSQNDITNYLESGSIKLGSDSIISSANFTFKNPSGYLSGENSSKVSPAMKIELFFSAGDSEDYPMGVFFIDRVNVAVGKSTIEVEARNISGKMLKEQQFNETNRFGPQLYFENIIDLLELAGILNADVQPLSGWTMGIQFPPEMDMLTGLESLIRVARDWRVIETLDGQIVAGFASYGPIASYNSKYTFNRGTDVFSRSIVRDDQYVFSRVCCISNYAYEDVNGKTVQATRRAYAPIMNDHEWGVVSQKTYNYNAPDETAQVTLQDIANDLASRLAKAGIMETFTGPFRPYLVAGDTAEIVSDEGTKMLGTITSIAHKFGINGYETSFVVDSAGENGKGLLTDYIQKINKKQNVGNSTIIY